MKTNIATGTFILGTVYSHDNMLIIGDQKKGMAFNLKCPEGLHHVYGETNEYGELVAIQINFKNGSVQETDLISLTKENVLYGNYLNELTPDQVKERLANQMAKCKSLINLIKVDDIRYGDNLTHEVDSLCKELRLKRHELFDLLVSIFEEAEDQAELKWKVEYLMSHLSVNGGFQGGLGND